MPQGIGTAQLEPMLHNQEVVTVQGSQTDTPRTLNMEASPGLQTEPRTGYPDRRAEQLSAVMLFLVLPRSERTEKDSSAYSDGNANDDCDVDEVPPVDCVDSSLRRRELGRA